MKEEMYYDILDCGIEIDMTLGQILDYLLPKHLDVINGEREADLSEVLDQAIEEEIEGLKKDIAVSEELLRKDMEECNDCLS